MTDETKPKQKPKKGGYRAGERTLKGHRLPETGLTVQQEAYCRARAMGMDIQSSILATGAPLHPNTAREWEREKPEIRKRIEHLSALASKNAILKTGLDREWVISRLMTVVERCMQAEPVKDKDGNETGEYKFDSNGANRALQLLGSELGMFTPKEEKPGDEYANLTDADIARIVGELAAQTGLLEAPSGTQAPAGSEQIIEVQAVSKAG